MEKLFSYCGIICQGCPIFMATQEKDKEKKEKMRVEISRLTKELCDMELKPEDVKDCDGCRVEGGRLFPESKKCKIRKCAREKGVENCAYCNEYPCEELKAFFASDPDAKARLDVIKCRL